MVRNCSLLCVGNKRCRLLLLRSYILPWALAKSQMKMDIKLYDCHELMVVLGLWRLRPLNVILCLHNAYLVDE